MDTQQPGDSIARDYQDHNDGIVNGKLDENDPENMLRQIKTSGTGSVTISSDLFERLYLQPKMAGVGLKHPLQKILGNPTALGIMGFEMSLMPIVMQLMEWRGAGASRAANNANVIFYGGVLMWVAGMLEFVLGNTFPFLVFMSFGSFYCSYGATLIPWFATYQSFSADPNGDPLAGLTDPSFNASYGHYWVVFTILMLFFFICTFRTNIVFVLLFACIVPGCGCIAGVFYNLALGKADQAHNCQVAAGAVLFAANIIGWYLYAALIFPSVDFPLALPLGDLSTVIPGLNDLRKGDSGSRRRPLLSMRKNKPADIEDAV
ncbi:hypothetical protein M409DRAFT_19023 [Zasmidium cellare ATCC 36951]|uniref:GPR1/FUN34/YaaH-class plasma membrane protein n=1 Tax=Zasmidium cellare ATCC 36951 TaxID=1080233 RepID=A0A6A6CXZ6_ZASCE|nr:uncharacterized protein M409DRAFT_19023 [Zasmidium cellare ATCC 36951]KAF2171050.1 hypothetical protein M409DRAFT_19023 [Zasmidium cellare ATCC 36951]